MSLSHDYNTEKKETSNSKILYEISNLKEELVENFKKSFTNLKMK